MNQTDMAQLVHELRRKHPDPAGEGDLGDFELTLALLPEHRVWRVADLTPTVFALTGGNRLVTISLKRSSAPGLRCTATLSSRTVEAEKLMARLEWGEYVRGADGEVWRRTRWTFPFQGQGEEGLEEWQQASGRIRTDVRPLEPDRDEQYARALFAWISRPGPPGELFAFYEQEPPDPPPGPASPRRGAVTDLWGNPIDKRRGRRR